VTKTTKEHKFILTTNFALNFYVCDKHFCR